MVELTYRQAGAEIELDDVPTKPLTHNLGRGFSKSNLFNMRSFYISYPNFPDASGKLTRSHYCEILSVSDESARSFYEKECVKSDWSVGSPMRMSSGDATSSTRHTARAELEKEHGIDASRASYAR